MQEWIGEFEHASITDDNREAFSKSMEKFPTVGDAAVGYMELQKTAGKPFKLPESMDKLPDDAARADFTTQTHKLMGTSPSIKSIEDLADVNFKEGLADDAVINGDMVSLIKQWAVGAGISKPALAKMVSFYNGGLADFALKGQEAATEAAKAEKVAKIASCNEAMATAFGTPEKLEENSVLLHRALIDNVGASTEEAEDIAEFMKSREGATNPALRKMLFRVIAPLAAENKNRGPGAGSPPAEKKDPLEGSPTYKAVGWSK